MAALHDDDLSPALAADLDGHFERLVIAYQNRLYAFALRMTARPQDAEEIVQDAFVCAYRALARYPAERVRALSPRPWLYRITLNVTRNRMRGCRLPVVPLDATNVLEQRAANVEQQPESRAEQSEQARELAAHVAELPPRYRVAVSLHYIAGLGYDEVATILGRPVGTVKSDAHRGLRLLRAALERAAAEIEGGNQR